MKKTNTVWSNDLKQIKSIVCDMENDGMFAEMGVTDECGKWEIARETNNDYLDDERVNLDRRTNLIIAIADLGLWNGRAHGYREIGYNLKDCLDSDATGVDWYCDRYNFKCTEKHHDGVNYIVYREMRTDLAYYEQEQFLDKLGRGKATDRDIRRYTVSLRPRLADVYGWEA